MPARSGASKEEGPSSSSSSSSERPSSPRYRVAMVCDFFYPRLGGVENHIWSLSQHLLKLGHKVIVITHAYGKGRKGVRYLPGPIKVYYCPLKELVDQDTLPSFTASLPLIRHILIRERIQIVHSHQATSTLANEACVYASALNLPSIYTDHSLFGFDDLASVILNRVLQCTLSTVDYAICVSHTCRDNLILRAHLNPERVVVVPNAVDPTKFRPGNGENSKNDDGRMKIVVISRLVYRKGIDLLIGILPTICQLFPHVDFIVGGDGSKMLALQEVVEYYRLQDRVEFLGSVPHAEVRSVLTRGHIFLNCSLTESFCIAILEAACCGLIVVSTNVGGVPEVLPDDMILLSDPSVPDLIQKIKLAINRYEIARRQEQQKQQRNDEAIESSRCPKSSSHDNDSSLSSSQCLLLDPIEAHKRVSDMYSWRRVAMETSQIYQMAMKAERRTFIERLQCYYDALGGSISGTVACLLAITLQLWLLFVERIWQPVNCIDIVPDLHMSTYADCVGEYDDNDNDGDASSYPHQRSELR